MAKFAPGERATTAPIIVTPRMINAGLDVLAKSGLVYEVISADMLLVEEIFRAMWLARKEQEAGSA